MTAALPTRRAVLAASACAPLAVALVGCTGPTPTPAPGMPSTRPSRLPAAPAPGDPDAALRAAAVQRERALVAEYDQALAAVPASGRLAPVLTALRDEHAQHLSALAAAAPPPVRPSGRPADPPSAGRVRARLEAAERAAAAGHAQDALPASRPLAALLATLAAAEAAHPVALA